MIVRPADRADAPTMAAILNEIIAIGGTTAHQDAKTVAAVLEHYVAGPDVLSSVVAEQGGMVVGWQATELWQGEADIGTFVQPGLQVRGAGAAMSRMTCQLLRTRGIGSIVAIIRADNAPGLAYYGRMGFRDFHHDPGFSLKDGRVVGRVHRRFLIV